MTALAAHQAYLAQVLDRQSIRRSLVDPNHTFPLQQEVKGYLPRLHQNAEAGPSKRHVVNYVEEEETVRNDLAERYVQSGEFGSNYILGASAQEICEEYPALRKLMDIKSTHVDQHSHPPIVHYLPDSTPASITSAISPTRFDVILLRPQGTWQETAALPIRNISSDPGFVFLWVGKGDDEGLEKGRECFAKWGFRRAEDIVWVKTNKSKNPAGDTGSTEDMKMQGGTGGEGLFASSKEHCLMGIRGTVRRSTDTRFVHCNVDTDILVWEQDEQDPDQAFPPYLYTLIENFCLGTRRLELFGNPSKPRRGWVTGTTAPRLHSNIQSESEPETIQFDPTTYPSLLPEGESRPVLPFHPEIDQLRPKSPTRRGGGAGGPGQGQGGGLPRKPHPHPPRFQPQHHPDMMAHAQAQAQMQMQMQMQQMHQAQMMAAMGMGGMGGMDPMMMAQMQAMAMAQGGMGDQGMYGGMQQQGQFDAQGQGYGQWEGQGQQQGQGQWDVQGQWDSQMPGQQWDGQGVQYPQYQQYQQFQQFPGQGWGWQQQ